MNHTFYVQAECLEAIKTLPTEKRNAMLGAIAGYQIDESMPDFENEMQVIFMIAKVFIDQRKRRSLSHTRGKTTSIKPKTPSKSTRESIKEIIEKINPEAKPVMPSIPEPSPKPSAQPSTPSSTQPKKMKKPKSTTKTPYYKDQRTDKGTSMSPDTQLAIKKLTVLCNKAKLSKNTK